MCERENSHLAEEDRMRARALVDSLSFEFAFACIYVSMHLSYPYAGGNGKRKKHHHTVFLLDDVAVAS